MINQKEYLKKYLSSGAPEDNKRKKKKKLKVGAKTVKIIDDDIDINKIKPIDDAEFGIFIDNEDAPQIVGVVDERGPVDFSDRKRWKIIADDGEEDIVFASDDRFLKQKNGNTKHEKLRKHKKISLQEDKQERREQNTDSDNDISPPRQKKKNNIKKNHDRKDNSSDTDESLPRRKSRKNDRNPSPPTDRKRENKSHQRLSMQRRKAEDSDVSPPRRSRKDEDSDLSPPRKTKKDADSDLSPPRLNTKDHNADLSPPRRKRKDKDVDLSPPRRKRKDDNSDSNLHRRKRVEKDTDLSPYRHNNNSSKRSRSPRHTGDRCESSLRSKYSEKEAQYKRSDKKPSRWNKNNDSDLSPPRRRTDTDSCSSKVDRKRDRPDNHLACEEKSKKERRKEPDSPEASERMTKTLDGKTAGLQDAKALREETEAYKKREAEHFRQLSKEVTGVGQAAVVRDTKSGRKRDLEAEAAEEREKQKRQEELDEKYAKWGRGLKQVEDRAEKLQDDLYEMTKPLARYADDADLDKRLREQEREGDPMLEYIKQKQIKEGKRKPDQPKYEGSFMPNRFGIKPGHRWDGVDRSNGYEKKWFEAQNAKVAIQEEAYKWSTSDM